MGEIEAVLRGLAGIEQAMVVAREEEEGAAKQLVGCVVGKQGVQLHPVRCEQLSLQLPEYMLLRLGVLEEQPPTSKGEVDRRRLAERHG